MWRVTMTMDHRPTNREKWILRGNFGSTSFVPWIERHARKLGLAEEISFIGVDRIEIELQGPAELIDAMEMGCSLGPIDVWVETILREPIGEA